MIKPDIIINKEGIELEIIISEHTFSSISGERKRNLPEEFFIGPSRISHQNYNNWWIQ